MIRLSAYLLALTLAVALIREAVTWAWIAHTSPLVLQGGKTSALPPVADKPSGASAAARFAEVDQRPLTAFPQTASRPVFFDGRRYPAKDEPKKSVQASPEERVPTVNVKELKLLGVKIAPGSSQALIANGAQPPAWINVGEKIMNWTVASVDANDVTLRREGQTADLRLYEP